SFSTSVVLPVPEGAETMKSRPRPRAESRGLPRAESRGLFNVLHLLAHLLELRLRVDDQFRDAETVGLRADRVHLAVHLLQEEIELPAARLGPLGQRIPVREVRAKARDL